MLSKKTNVTAEDLRNELRAAGFPSADPRAVVDSFKERGSPTDFDLGYHSRDQEVADLRKKLDTIKALLEMSRAELYKQEHTVCETKRCTDSEVAGEIERKLNDGWKLAAITATTVPSTYFLVFTAIRW